MEKKSAKKRGFILSKAKQVFIQKGFAAVTMKDIIEECGISRGGLYLYFQSVDEIFMQVINLHNEQKLKEAKSYMSEATSFQQLIDGYFEKQKTRLLNINNSLLIAMYEYRFGHKHDYDQEFFYNQLMRTKDIVLEILRYGVSAGEISNDQTEDMAMNIVFTIEGISMLGTAAGISEEWIDRQIAFIKKMIFSQRE